MKAVIAFGVAAAGLLGARIARMEAKAEANKTRYEEPFAPSPAAAPFLSVGFHEAVADLLFVRLRTYFGGETDNAQGVAQLAEAIAATDPRFHRIYEYGAHAMLLSPGSDQETVLRAIKLLEGGAQQFPDDYRLPLLAGQIYTQDLVTTDAAQRRAWDERGTALVEAATRKPNAPANSGEWVAVMRTKLGEHERAVAGLRELILMTNDKQARKNLIERLAKLEESDADSVAAELLGARADFERQWLAARPAVPATYYILLGVQPAPGFDMGDLATGGRELATTPFERLEPLYDTPEQPKQ